MILLGKKNKEFFTEKKSPIDSPHFRWNKYIFVGESCNGSHPTWCGCKDCVEYPKNSSGQYLPNKYNQLYPPISPKPSKSSRSPKSPNSQNKPIYTIFKFLILFILLLMFTEFPTLLKFWKKQNQV